MNWFSQLFDDNLLYLPRAQSTRLLHFLMFFQGKLQHEYNTSLGKEMFVLSTMVTMVNLSLLRFFVDTSWSLFRSISPILRVYMMHCLLGPLHCVWCRQTLRILKYARNVSAALKKKKKKSLAFMVFGFFWINNVKMSQIYTMLFLNMCAVDNFC